MQRAGLVASEEAVFEKDGRVIPYRKISATDAGLETRETTPLALLLSDGIAEEFASPGSAPKRKRSAESSGAKASRSAAAVPAELTGVSAALAAKLKEWRTSEARRLKVPPFIVCHDRALNAVAAARPVNLRQLLEVDGIGPRRWRSTEMPFWKYANLPLETWRGLNRCDERHTWEVDPACRGSYH